MGYTTMIVIIIALVMSGHAWENWLDAKYHLRKRDTDNEDDNRN